MTPLPSPFEHRVRRQRLELEVASEELALALQPRLPDLNRRHLVPVIERVLEEMAVPGRQVRIPALEIDLGTLRSGDLEHEAERRLERELRRALGDALRRSERGGGPERWEPEAATHRRLLEHHLAHGTLPFWAPRPDELSLDELVRAMAEEDAAGLVATVRRLGRREEVLQRLAARLDETSRQRLLRLLEPRQATFVLAYLDELEESHEEEPLVPLPSPRLSRLLWYLTHAYLLRDPGTQFNRTSFVGSLLRGMAGEHGLDYAALLLTLRRGLQRLQSRRRSALSLPAVVERLTGELDAGVLERAGSGERAPGEVGSAPAGDRPGGREPPAAAAPAGTPRPDEGDRGGAPSARAAARYELAEALRYLLAHGVVPWELRLREPDLTAEGLLLALPGLPRSLLPAVLAGDDREARRTALLRAARALPEDRLATWLLRLLPAARSEGPLRDSLASRAERARDRAGFLAAVVAALLEGEPLDLEALAAPEAGAAAPRALPGPAAGWPAHLVASVLLAALRPDRRRQGGVPDEGSSAAALAVPVDELDPGELLTVLLEEHPSEAHDLLARVSTSAASAAALARTASRQQAESAVALLRPDAAPALGALAAALANLPAPYRPGSPREISRVLLHEALLLGSTAPLSARFFARVIERLFGARPPEAVVRALGEEAGRWTGGGDLPEAHGEALARALESGTPEEGSAGEEREPPPRVPRPPEEEAQRRAALAVLTGGEEVRGAEEEGADEPVDEAPPVSLPREALGRAVLAVLDGEAGELPEVVRRRAADRRTRELWARRLPETALVRLGGLLEPRRHVLLLDTAELLASAWAEVAPAGQPTLTGRTAFWTFLLGFLARHGGGERPLETLVPAFFADVAARHREVSPSRAGRAELGSALLDATERLARSAGHARLRSLLRRHGERLVATFDPSVAAAGRAAATGPLPEAMASEEEAPRRERPRRTGERRPAAAERPAFGLEDDGDVVEEGEPIYVGNAGLVLANPYLPTLFRKLGILQEPEEGGEDEEDGEGLGNRAAASRAVHLLQYLVDGRTSAPEPELVLNKVLCGLAPETPVDVDYEPGDEERETLDDLLRTMLSNWPALSGTSVAGLRETFLQRDGRLTRREDGWYLKVQRKTLDVLVDQVPWSLAVIYPRWMPAPLHVDW